MYISRYWWTYISYIFMKKAGSDINFTFSFSKWIHPVIHLRDPVVDNSIIVTINLILIFVRQQYLCYMGQVGNILKAWLFSLFRITFHDLDMIWTQWLDSLHIMIIQVLYRRSCVTKANLIIRIMTPWVTNSRKTILKILIAISVRMLKQINFEAPGSKEIITSKL